MRALIAMMLLLIAGCAETHTLTACRGSFQAANPGKWQATAEDLR